MLFTFPDDTFNTYHNRIDMSKSCGKKLLIEPFYGGSHRQLMDLLCAEIPGCELFTLPAKKWPWRARTSALYFAQIIPQDAEFSVLFCSSVLNVAELVSLRPDLGKLRKVVYFHENQLVYPIRKQAQRGERDFQFGYNQILTALVADVVVFNSHYNQESFLDNIQSFLKLIPDHRPKNLAEQIRPKCTVAYFPIKFPKPSVTIETEASSGGSTSGSGFADDDVISRTSDSSSAFDCCLEESVCKKSKVDQERTTPSHSQSTDPVVPHIKETDIHITDNLQGDDVPLVTCASKGTQVQKNPLVICWTHRWEHDKNPDLFFQTIYKLKDDGLDFRVVVMGESYSEVPDIFPEAQKRLHDNILCWGYQATKADYYRALENCDVSVSTAIHEFYGVAMLESVSLGCYPLVPNNLVYPEIFPKECLYNTDNQLYKRLRHLCRSPDALRSKRSLKMDLEKFSWKHLRTHYTALLSDGQTLYDT